MATLHLRRISSLDAISRSRETVKPLRKGYVHMNIVFFRRYRVNILTGSCVLKMILCPSITLVKFNGPY